VKLGSSKKIFLSHSFDRLSSILINLIFSVLKKLRGVRGEFHFLPFLLNNCSAGQPISLCLQNLQAKEPRTKLFPAEVRIANNTINSRINQLKLNINNALPTNKGIIETRKSGSISFQQAFFNMSTHQIPDEANYLNLVF